MRLFNSTKMILQTGVIIFIALSFVMPVFVEGRIILDEGYDYGDVQAELSDYNVSKAPKPAFMISVVGGKGFMVTITNVGEANATDATCNVTIEGGLFMSPKNFNGTTPNIGIGGNFTIICLTKGIGIGIFIPIPTIIISVNCTEGINATQTVQAKIFFSMVTLQ